MSRGQMPVYLGLGIQTPVLLGHVPVDEDPVVMAADVARLLFVEANALLAKAQEADAQSRYDDVRGAS